MTNICVAIHASQGSFSDAWITFCEKNNITYKLVNCYDTNIIKQLVGVDVLLWHWHFADPTAVRIARDVIYAAEAMGLQVFPDTATCRTYDKKISQKYLLEAIGAPLAPVDVFFDEQSAMDWIRQVSFPKVFKLSCGAGSLNVKLVHNANEACSLLRKAFRGGFKPVSGHVGDLFGKLRSKESRKKVDLLGKIRRLPQSLRNIYYTNKSLGRERGYIYFQEFMPENTFDTRITVIGNRAFGFTRNVREKDFRASGSGSIDYSTDRIDPKSVTIAFEVARKLKTQSIAFDFVSDANNDLSILEISYCYKAEAVYDCPTYWDDQLELHEGHIWPQDAILSDLLAKVNEKT